jgi:hypothetical protein
MHFQLHHLIHDVSPKFQTYQKIHNVWQLFLQNCFEESGGLKWCRVVIVLLHIYSGSWKHLGTGRWLLKKVEAVRVSEMTVLVHNCRRTTCSSHAGLRHNGGWSALKRWYIWRISPKLILNCLHTMCQNKRQAGETTGNEKSAGNSWICDTGFNWWICTYT